MPIIEINGKTLYPRERETILETLEREGYCVEYQCRQGYCGSCRLKFLQGEVAYLSSPLAYVRADELLSCCAIVRKDLKIVSEIFELSTVETGIYYPKNQKMLSEKSV
ncbi:class I ribonucleotide reductase maintenance protein YfaE [Suttonella ornithocola]|uniref:2Fe-2S ferredoxin YfaE n=1 Tax=Suttonella ornithocola TaxID=279832 RepID=A0A380MSP1_9GAMM|nr:class I ribonucleotide reductase maintenance protein YfaE [Suttonella ornithocola]SUO95308.1 2Fe-2S ferredoxin YfaE [Suttonella ornithocola]